MQRPHPNLLSHPRRWAASGMLVAALTGGYDYLNQDRADIAFGPKEAPKTQTLDTLKVATLNVHKLTAEQIGGSLIYLIKHYDLDALGAQEVTTDAAKKLGPMLAKQGIYGRYDEADNRQNPDSGGNGIMILSRDKPSDYHHHLFKGNSNAEFAAGTAFGAGRDAAIVTSTSAWALLSLAGSVVGLDKSHPNTSFKHSREGLVENRNAIAETLDTNIGAGHLKWRFITAHLANRRGTRIDDEQYADFYKFLGDLSKKDIPAVICADWNKNPSKVQTDLTDRRYGLVSFKPGSVSTTIKQRSHIDQCAVFSDGKLGIGKAEVVTDDMGSDHRPVIAEIPIEQP